jgi:hypothetical protein
MQCNVLRDEDKIDVLYGEASPEVAAIVREHLATCAECRQEMSGLERTREGLAGWTLPSSLRAPARPPALRWALPMAAAVLLAIGGVVLHQGTELSYEAGRFSARFGLREDRGVRELLAAQDARHAREMAALRAVLPASSTAVAPGLDDAVVRSLIRDSEERLDRRVEARLAELRERADAQRRIDMARVSTALSYLEGKNGQQMARTSELMTSMLQASYKR